MKYSWNILEHPSHLLVHHSMSSFNLDGHWSSYRLVPKLFLFVDKGKGTNILKWLIGTSKKHLLEKTVFCSILNEIWNKIPPFWQYFRTSFCFKRGKSLSKISNMSQVQKESYDFQTPCPCKCERNFVQVWIHFSA